VRLGASSSVRVLGWDSGDTAMSFDVRTSQKALLFFLHEVIKILHMLLFIYLLDQEI
jgi:hypothetical protein